MWEALAKESVQPQKVHTSDALDTLDTLKEGDTGEQQLDF